MNLLKRPSSLIRATAENGLLERLKNDWDRQLAGDDEPRDYYEVWIERAREIASEDPADPRYGIYVLQTDFDEKSLDGIVHVNHKLPRTSDAEVRLVWSILAPKFSRVEAETEELSEVVGGFLYGGLRLAATEMQADAMRMYLQNQSERQYARAVALALRHFLPDLRVSMAGSWLLMSNIQKGTEDVAESL